MTKEKAISCLAWLQTAHSAEYAQALDIAICVLKNKQTGGDVVSKSVFDQIKWERDVAISQLHDLGYELGQKPKASKDLIAEIDKLPRIKVGNSNSPTVKYCIDEVLLYELLENYKGESKEEE